MPVVRSLFDDDGKLITEIRASDGFVNATLMCKSAGKEWSNYIKSKEVNTFLKALSEQLNTEYEVLVQSASGRYGGTWVHFCIAIHLAQWISTHFAMKMTLWVKTAKEELPSVDKELYESLETLRVDRSLQIERSVRQRLASSLHGEQCVKGEYGEINIVSDEEVIEVTWAPKFSHALGQVLVHSESFPDKRRRVHLFGSGDDCSPEKMSRVSVVFEKFGVVLTYEIVDGLKTVM
jgi:hypothetical protein